MNATDRVHEEATLSVVEPFPQSFQVAVVDDDPGWRARLVQQLGQRHPSAYQSLEQLDEAVRPGTAVVVVLGPSFANDDGFERIEKLSRQRGNEVGSVMVIDLLSTDVLRRALRAGVRDVIEATGDGLSLIDAVDRVGESLTSTTPSAYTPAPIAPAPTKLGRVITCFSTKGGAGKSVIACNLAISLAQRSDRPVVLVDGDLQFGDVAVMLKLTPQHTVVDAVANMHRLDATLLQSLLVRHEQSGLWVLPAPVEPAFADQVSANDMVRIVQLLQETTAYVVIDTSAQFNDVVLNLLEMTDDILLIAGMDIPNIKNAKLGLQTLRLLNIPTDKLKLVMNRANSKVKLDVGEVERTLQMKADVLVPSDIVVPQSMNKGVPAVLDAPKSGVAKSIEQLADLYEPEHRSGRRK